MKQRQYSAGTYEDVRAEHAHQQRLAIVAIEQCDYSSALVHLAECVTLVRIAWDERRVADDWQVLWDEREQALALALGEWEQAWDRYMAGKSGKV